MRAAIGIVALACAGCPVASNCPNGTDTNCGGPSCPACAPGQKCRLDADCASGSCTGGVCASHGQGSPIAGLATIDPAFEYRVTAGAAVAGPRPGADAGYYVTASASSPAALRIEWTGGRPASHFWGSLWTTGHFSSVTPGCAGGACALAMNDWVSDAYAVSGGQRIDFDAETSYAAVGFEFTSDVQPILFDLYIEATQPLTEVYWPSADTSPPNQLVPPGGFPFGLSVK